MTDAFDALREPLIPLAPRPTFAATLRRCRPYRLQDFLRLPVVAAVIEHDAVAQRRMPRRHVAAKARRHQRRDLRQRFVIGTGSLGRAGNVGPSRQRQMAGA